MTKLSTLLCTYLGFSFVLTLTSVLAAPSVGMTDNSLQAFSAPQRKANIEKTMRAFADFDKTSLRDLKQIVENSEQHKCRSFFSNLTLNCLQKEVQNFCAQKNLGQACSLLADVLVVNKVNERLFLTREERFKISQTTDQYQKTLAKTLEMKYALLATELLFSSKTSCSSEDRACLAASVDDYCLKNADVKNIPWQACVAAITGFIATPRKEAL